MGYYIQVPENHHKAQQIEQLYGGMVLPGRPDSFARVPKGKALICVVDNGLFEGAAFCYSEKEFDEFASSDGRPRTWLLIDWDKACTLTGF